MITQLIFFPFTLLAFQWHIPESHGRWGCESAQGETGEILPSGKSSLFRHIQWDSALEIKLKNTKKWQQCGYKPQAVEKMQSQHKVCGYSFCQILPAFPGRVGSLNGVEPQAWLGLDGTTQLLDLFSDGIVFLLSKFCFDVCIGYCDNSLHRPVWVTVENSLRLEGIWGGHPVQPPTQSRVTLNLNSPAQCFGWLRLGNIQGWRFHNLHAQA